MFVVIVVVVFRVGCRGTGGRVNFGRRGEVGGRLGVRAGRR